jgi:transcriptional regulator with XRE-family HTH domain
MASETAKRFAAKLKALRDHAGLSQYELAKRSKLTAQAVSLLEQGERDPTWETVQALAKGLGVECTALTTADDRAPPAIGAAPSAPPTDELQSEGRRKHGAKAEGPKNPTRRKKGT